MLLEIAKAKPKITILLIYNIVIHVIVYCINLVWKFLGIPKNSQLFPSIQILFAEQAQNSWEFLGIAETAFALGIAGDS